MNNLIATSRRGEMRALAVQGIFATGCHAPLLELVSRHLGPARTALLAEPQPEPEVIDPFLGETPREEPKPEPRPAPKPRKGEDMAIPDDAAKKQDLRFLEGCRVSETGLYSHPSNKPLVAEYCFDKNGRGRRFAREKGGRVCSAPAQARFRNGKLDFDADCAACPCNDNFVPQQVECTGSDNRTHCRGKELNEGHGTTWRARFKRK